MDVRTRERIKRVHAWTGIAPLGLFVVAHLVGNATVLWGRQPFEDHLAWVDALPARVLIEILLIALPMVVHVALGLRLWLEPGEAVTGPQPRDWNQALQRATGLVVLVFIALHVGHARWPHATGELAAADLYDRMSADLQSMSWFAVYLAGSSAVVFHLANGLWRRWSQRSGLSALPPARRRAALACGAIGLGLWILVLEILGYFYAGATLSGAFAAAAPGGR